MIGNGLIIGISIVLFWNVSVAQSIFQNEDNTRLLTFLKTLNMENCVEDVPAPELMIEPRFTQGSTNKIYFRLPEIGLIPFSLDSVKNPFVISLVRNTKNNVLFQYPRPVALNKDSIQSEIINAIAHDTEYIYSIKLFLPVCTVGCDNVLDGSELDLHCSAYEDTVFSTQDSEPPIVQNILIPGLIFLSDNNWLNKSNFMINAELVDPAGIWQAFLYRRDCTENGWDAPAIDTTFTGVLTNTGYVFDDRISVIFSQNLPDGCYEFRIEGKDASHTPESCFPNFKIAGNGGPPGEGAVSHIKINIDTTPPEAVEISCRQIKNTMALSWKPSQDFNTGIGLDGYRILRDGQLLDSLEANVLSYVDTILADTPDKIFVYQVQPFDSLGNIQTGGGQRDCPYRAYRPVSMIAEPQYTPGDSNLVRWTGWDNIDVYTVNMARHQDFQNALKYDVSDTCYTFHGLIDGMTYSYWVEANDRQLRSIISDTVRSIQDASKPEITLFDVAEIIDLNAAAWLQQRPIKIHLEAFDRTPGVIEKIEVFENNNPGLLHELNPENQNLEITLDYSIESDVCEPFILSVKATDVAGNTSDMKSRVLRLDDVKPQPATAFTCNQLNMTNGINLQWQASVDPGNCSGLAGYTIFRDDNEIAKIPPDLISYRDLFNADTPSKLLTYRIEPFDSVGNVQTEGEKALCEYIGTSSIVIQQLSQFTPGLSSEICWQVSGSLVQIRVYVDSDCNAVPDDSILISNPSSTKMCQTFNNLADGQNYCYWVVGIDAQERIVASEIVTSTQDNSAPVIDNFTFPKGEVVNEQLWAYDTNLELNLVAHDFHTGEIWDYILVESGREQPKLTFPDSVSYVNEKIVYEIKSNDRESTKTELSIKVIDGAGNISAEKRLTVFLQEQATNMFAFPNPFNPNNQNLTIRLKSSDETELNIYDFFGNFVKKISVKINSHDFVWDGRNGNGELVANGGYVCVGQITNTKFKIGVVKKND